MGVGIIRPTEGMNRTKKREEGWIQALCLDWGIHLFLPKDISVSGSKAFRFRLELILMAIYSQAFRTYWITPTTFLVLQFADSRSWDCSTARFYNRATFIYLSIYPTTNAKKDEVEWFYEPTRPSRINTENRCFLYLPGSSPGWSRVFEAGTASATYLIIYSSKI